VQDDGPTVELLPAKTSGPTSVQTMMALSASHNTMEMPCDACTALRDRGSSHKFGFAAAHSRWTVRYERRSARPTGE
jgi:hypothetical protein